MTDSPTLADLAPALAAAFREHDYSVPGLERALGPSAVAALGRSDAPAVRRAAGGAGPASARQRGAPMRGWQPAQRRSR